MYSTKPSIVLGFHGCDKERQEQLVNSNNQIYISDKDYDWLGNGMYFWEGNLKRAELWAQDKFKDNPGKTPSVIGAVIDMGTCLDLVDSSYLELLKASYRLMKKSYDISGISLPKNTRRHPGDTTLLKRLDCAVIEFLHERDNSFDSVRGVFWEGGELYEGTDHKEKNHIQICIRNPNCIKGFFVPREVDTQWRKP